MMEARSIWDSGGLEIRTAPNSHFMKMIARFHYERMAVVDAGGNGRRPRKEKFAPKAFNYAVKDPERDIHLLSGHSFDKPLASKKAGTLILNDTPEALEFEAKFPPPIQRTTWFQDMMASYEAGLLGGISPGFRVAPPEAVGKAEETTEENPRLGHALIRTIFHAILFELSLVTRPAYPETEVEIEGDDEEDDEERSASGLILPRRSLHVSGRWR